MSGEGLRRATATELRAAFRSGEATSRAVTDELLDVIEREDRVDDLVRFLESCGHPPRLIRLGPG